MKWRQKKSRWQLKLELAQLKQELAAPGRFYGDDGTILQTTVLDVETHCGTVVAVWFRCQPIAFEQTEVDDLRAASLEAVPSSRISGVQVNDD